MGDGEIKVDSDIADAGDKNNNGNQKNIKIEEPLQSNSETVQNMAHFANGHEDRRASKMDGKRGSKFSRRSSKPRKSSAVPPKVIDLDDVLINELGQFGKFQFYSLLLVSVPIIMSPFPGEYVFTAAAIPHRCRISECGETTKDHPFEPSWLPGAIPHTNNDFSSCERYVPVASGTNGTLDVCPAELFTNATTTCDDGYVYERNNSLVYDFDLGCQEWLRTLAGTLNSVGTLLVLPIIGFISDRYGRRVALIISVFNLGLIGFIRAFSVNYAMYVTLQLLQTTLGAGTFSAAYIFAAELVGPKYRVFTSATCSSMFAVGQVILGAVAWLVQPWRYLIMTLHIPCFIIIVYYWIMNESVRWLLSKKMFVEARAILEKVAKVNKKQISEKSMEALMNPPQIPIEIKNEEGPSLITYVVRSPVLLRRVCTTPIWWITTTLVYYGLTINSVGFADNIYLNYILVSAVEIPGFYTAVLILNRIGRRSTISLGFFLSAACNVVFILISNDMTGVRLAMFLIGKFSISVVLTSIYLYTSELYPTQYRHSMLAFSSMIGRIGSIVAPLTPVLAEYWEGIPSVMFAAMALLSGVLVLTQPETLGTRMPDTLVEAEFIGRPESKVNNNTSRDIFTNNQRVNEI